MRPELLKTLKHGARGKCPRCGKGALFRRWIEAHDRCTSCGLLYQRNYGDTWMFWIITDRIPLFIGIVAVYFGFRTSTWVTIGAFFCALVLPLIATIKPRMGIAIALDYLSRVYLPDPSDEIHADSPGLTAGSRAL
jgi:uncharacterized protein (DUF983 family)